MKKNILIITLLLVSSLSLLYAYVKAGEASHAQINADETRGEILSLRDEMEKMNEMAKAAASEAKRKTALALETLDNCQSKKQ